MPLATVQQLYGLGDRVDRIRVLLDSSDDRDLVQSAIAQRLPAELTVQAPVAQMELAGSILRSTELALSFAGALSMAMAGFIVLNTLRMNFGERRRDMAILRVLGVTVRQLVALNLAEGVLSGPGRRVVGMPLGVALGRGLAGVMRRLADANIAEPQMPYWTLVVALVAGPLVAGLAALVPALQSRGISPVEALGDSEVRRGERFPLAAIIVGLIVWSIAAVLLLLVAAERISAQLAIPAGLLMLLGFIAVIPAVLAPVVRWSARLLAPLMPTEGSFAAEQLLQRPTRTVLTVGVLIVAISSGVGMGNAIINNVHDVRAWYRRMMTGDVMVAGQSTAEGLAATRESPSVRQAIAERPQVDYVTESRYFSARVDGVPTMCYRARVRSADGAHLGPFARGTSTRADGIDVGGNRRGQSAGQAAWRARRGHRAARNSRTPVLLPSGGHGARLPARRPGRVFGSIRGRQADRSGPRHVVHDRRKKGCADYAVG